MTRRLATFFAVLLTGQAAANDQQFAEMEWMTTTSGVAIENCQIGYRTSGELNADRSNVILFPTWFTGTTELLYSTGLIGPGKLADTDHYYVVAVDALGNGVSCSPSNTNDFPAVSIEDMVRSQHWLLSEHLDIDQVHAVMGFSMGGMQTFQWMSAYPDFMAKAIPIDGTPRNTSFDLVQWQTHRDIIRMMRAGGMNDEEIGMILSRVGLLSLYTPEYFVAEVPTEAVDDAIKASDAVYMEISVDDYAAQLEAIINHDVIGDSDESISDYVRSVEADVLIVGVPSDHMVNQTPSRRIARALGAPFFEVISNCGHLGTMCEQQKVAARVAQFLAAD